MNPPSSATQPTANVVPVTIQAPQTNDTVALTFTVAGAYDTTLGATSVQVQLLDSAGNPVGAPVNGAFVAGRPVWTATLTAPAAGTYGVKVTLRDATGMSLGTFTTSNLTAASAPTLAITAPAHATNPGGVNVNVAVGFAAMHPFVSLDIGLYSASGTRESGFVIPVAKATVSVGPHVLTGAAGELHYVRAVGSTATGALHATTIGGIRLS